MNSRGIHLCNNVSQPYLPYLVDFEVGRSFREAQVEPRGLQNTVFWTGPREKAIPTIVNPETSFDPHAAAVGICAGSFVLEDRRPIEDKGDWRDWLVVVHVDQPLLTSILFGLLSISATMSVLSGATKKSSRPSLRHGKKLIGKA